MQVRKLIAHGPSSLTIALPHKWIKKHELQKGDTLNIDEDEQGLRITSSHSERKKSLTINLKSHDWPSTVSVLTTVYRRGYSEVVVLYETSEEYQNIATVVRNLLGFAIMENKRGRCLIRSLPTELEQDFNGLFRRVFLILLQQLDDLKEILGDKNALKTFFHRDADLNALVNLSIRMIAQGYVNDRFAELHFFHALLVLEECGDDITRFTIELQNYSESAKLKKGVEHCSSLLRLLYESHFQKNRGIQEFFSQYYLYWPGTKKVAAPVYEFFAKETSKTFYLRSIIEKVIQLAEILLLPQVEE
ncbi:AbrB/MazE/SpoVT family DNA-binding domain-containing protein [Candidatus Woesearchaeota archaeon]|nr:AbrB/MazE/SpoVT family DNA-binding domain-containing protein [Candidatus Woesearchaeota archaeon]